MREFVSEAARDPDAIAVQVRTPRSAMDAEPRFARHFAITSASGHHTGATRFAARRPARPRSAATDVLARFSQHVTENKQGESDDDRTRD